MIGGVLDANIETKPVLLAMKFCVDTEAGTNVTQLKKMQVAILCITPTKNNLLIYQTKHLR